MIVFRVLLVVDENEEYHRACTCVGEKHFEFTKYVPPGAHKQAQHNEITTIFKKVAAIAVVHTTTTNTQTCIRPENSFIYLSFIPFMIHSFIHVQFFLCCE